MARWHLSAAAVGIAVCAIGCGEGEDSKSDAWSCPALATGTDDTPAPAPYQVFVDPTQGDDSNPGTEQAPFRTLKAALGQAVSGQSIRLQGGTYSTQTGEDWSIPVPDGVLLSAVTPGQSILAGTPEATGLRFAGNSEVRSLVLTGFGQALSADTGSHTWVDLTLKDNGTALSLAGEASATGEGLDIESKAPGIVQGFALRGSSTLLLRNSSLHDLGTACGHGQVGSVSKAASFTGVGLDVHDADGGVSVSGAATATLTTSALTRVGADGCGNGEAIALGDVAWMELNDVTISGLRGAAVLLDGASRAIVVDGTIETDKAPAILVRGGAVHVESTKLAAFDSVHGALVAMAGTVVSVESATFSGCSTCIVVDGGSVALRGATFEAAGTAVDLASGTLDLGNADDPGHNVFGGVSGTALLVRAQGPLEIPAAGNLWKQAQGALLGLYPVGSIVEGPAGCEDAPPRNYCVEHAASVLF